VRFTGAEEFELHVHKCFTKIFELLMKMDAEVKKEAEKEEQEQRWGLMCDMRDWMEETILHCHLAWQYHRLAMGPLKSSTWDRIEQEKNKKQSEE